MINPLFILKDEEYQNGLFPQIPNYNKKDSWFLLTDGVADDIIVDDITTIKQIRQGRYNRFVEISKIPHLYTYTFDSSCKETSYTFKVTVKAIVSVENPINFYSNIRSVDINDFFNNQFSLDVGKVTRNYSILNYNGIDDELTEVLTRIKVVDSTTGLSYQISAVMTQPNEASIKVLKAKDDMAIRSQLTANASNFAQLSKGKTYEDAIWEEVAQGIVSDTEAIQKIDEYRRQSYNEKFNTLIKLRDEGFITDDDIAMQKHLLLPMNNQFSVKKDEIQFIAVAPKVLIKGSKALINIYMFEEMYRNMVDNDIKIDKSYSTITTTGFLGIVRETGIRIVLESQDIEIVDNIVEAVWQGGYNKFIYDVFLPQNTLKKQILFCGKVYFNGVLVTKIKFIVQVSAKSSQKLKVDKIRPQSAFISYASQDRPKVAARIQGMTKIIPDLNVFFDIKSLRSGQYWDSILWKEIENRDIFFLFWSRYAKTSEYVTKEWKYALEIKGIDAIEPVPLESPELCPPPVELQDKHFNDWMLMYTV